MSLIKTIDQVLLYVDIDKDTSLSSLEPDFKTVESDFIPLYLGSSLYDRLKAAADDESSASAEELKALEAWRAIVINIGMSYAIDSLTLFINDNAITVGESSREKQPYKYQVENFRKQCLKRGYSGIEVLLEYLEQNTAIFPEWSEAEASNTTHEFFINSAKEFQQYENIKGNRLTFEAFKPLMRDVETISLGAVLGDTYLEELKNKLQDDNLSTDELAIVNNFIRKAMAKLTVADACDALAVEIQHDALVVNQSKQSGEEQTTPNQPLIDRKRTFAERKGKYYLNKLREHLNKYASNTLFATYYNSEKYTSPQPKPEALETRNIYRA